MTAEGDITSSMKRACLQCGKEFGLTLSRCPHDGTELTPIADSLVGTILAERYEILSLVGRGGMSVVYKGRHMLLDKVVAVKMLQPHLVSNAQSLSRFQQEGKVVSNLSHPNIVGVSDFGVSPQSQPYLVMDFLEGRGLDDLIEEEGRLSFRRAVPIFLQACEALAYAHKLGVVHRDLKPSNLMLLANADGGDLVKIVDFGIAKLMPQDGRQVQQLTQTGEVFGSPLYMSPEQCMGQQIDGRSDLFSLGCIMYEALAGKPPFLGENMLETMYKRLSDELVPLKQSCPDADVAPQLEAVVIKALARDAGERYQTMEELRDDLILLQSGKEGLKAVQFPASLRPLKQAGRWSPANLRLVAVMAALLVLAGGALAWDLGTRGHAGAALFNPVAEFRWRQAESSGSAAFERGDYPAAETSYQQAVSEAEKFGRLDKRVVRSLKNLSRVYLQEGKLLEMEKVNQRVALIRKERLAQEYGDDDNDVVQVANAELSSVSRQVDYSNKAQAEEEVERLTGLAMLCADQGKYSEARRLLEQATRIEEMAFGKRSQRATYLLNALANLYVKAGMLDRAEPVLKKAVSLTEELGGKENPYLTANLRSLGHVYEKKGDVDQAMQCHVRALNIAEKAYGHDHPEVASCLTDYAKVLRKRDQHSEASSCELRARAIRTKAPAKSQKS